MIKKFTFGIAALSMLSAVAFAGTEATPVDKNPVPPPCPAYYSANEFSISLFGLGVWRGGSSGGNGVTINGHTFGGRSNAFGNDGRGGGGGEFQYFFTRNIGVGLEGAGYALEHTTAGSVAGNIYLRAPLDECSHVAPYIYGGIGGLFADKPDLYFNGKNYGGGTASKFEGHFGGGLEYRFTQHFGTFVDGRYVIVDGNNGAIPKYVEVRGGFKYAF